LQEQSKESQVRGKKKEEDSPVISKRQVALPGGHRTSGGHGRTKMQPLSPFLSLHLGTSRTSAGAVLDQSLVRISVTEPTSAQRFKGLLLREEGRKGLELIPVIGRPAEDWDFPHKVQRGGMS
jgi:hypothetical protein